MYVGQVLGTPDIAPTRRSAAAGSAMVPVVWHQWWWVPLAPRLRTAPGSAVGLSVLWALLPGLEAWQG